MPSPAGYFEGLSQGGRNDLYAGELLRPRAEGRRGARLVAAPVPAGAEAVVEGAQGLHPHGRQAGPAEGNARPVLEDDGKIPVEESQIDPVHRVADGALP